MIENSTKTRTLFYEDNYQTTFIATVLDCQESKNGFLVVLDQTLFYPEGGGQPADIGFVNEAEVFDVHEKEGVITHHTDKPLPVGTIVQGEIDWAHRFPLMQHHTGEHIVSGIIHRLFGYDNVGFHMGKENVTFDINGELSEEQLRLVERLANEALYRNIQIKTYFPNEEELAALPYRSKKALSGNVRIVEIPMQDTCACCGLHCAYSAEVGIVQFLQAQRYKGGMRISMLCGGKAVRDYAQKNKDIYEISAFLSVKPNEVKDAVKKLMEEKALLKLQWVQYKTELFQLKAEQIPPNTAWLCLFEKDLQPMDLQRYCTLLCERANLVAVFSAESEGVYKYALARKGMDAREYGKELNAAFGGRGGGKAELVQGTILGAEDEIREFFRMKEQKRGAARPTPAPTAALDPV